MGITPAWLFGVGARGPGKVERAQLGVEPVTGSNRSHPGPAEADSPGAPRWQTQTRRGPQTLPPDEVWKGTRFNTPLFRPSATFSREGRRNIFPLPLLGGGSGRGSRRG